jgi:hypothetical protein
MSWNINARSAIGARVRNFTFLTYVFPSNVLQVNYVKRSSFEFSFGIFKIRFANLKNSLQIIEGICNFPVCRCNIPTRRKFLSNFPNFLF